MRSDEIEIGRKYVAKVSKTLTTVRVDDVRSDWQGRARYDVTNLRTGRQTTFRSAAKFRQAIDERGELE